MGNFYLDNEDIQFYFKAIDVKKLAEIQEDYAENGDAGVFKSCESGFAY